MVTTRLLISMLAVVAVVNMTAVTVEMCMASLWHPKM
jgi:hypothetical protein